MLYRRPPTTNPGRKPSHISEIANAKFRPALLPSNTSKHLTLFPMFFQQYISHHLYFNHDNCSAICCQVFMPCQKYFKCFHHCSGLLAPYTRTFQLFSTAYNTVHLFGALPPHLLLSCQVNLLFICFSVLQGQGY